MGHEARAKNEKKTTGKKVIRPRRRFRGRDQRTTRPIGFQALKLLSAEKKNKSNADKAVPDPARPYSDNEGCVERGYPPGTQGLRNRKQNAAALVRGIGNEIIGGPVFSTRLGQPRGLDSSPDSFMPLRMCVEPFSA